MLQIGALVAERRKRGRKRKSDQVESENTDTSVQHVVDHEVTVTQMGSSRSNAETQTGSGGVHENVLAQGVGEQAMQKEATQPWQGVQSVLAGSSGFETQDSSAGTSSISCLCIPTSTVSQCATLSAVGDFKNRVPSIHSKIGDMVSLSLKSKIIEGEYVDIGLLLDTKTEEASTRNLVVNSSGEIQLKPITSSSGVKISNIETWTDGFIVYISIYTAAHPEKYQDVLKYMNVVRTAAKRCRGLGWKNYDEHFRHRMSTDPSRSWSEVDYELVVICIFT